MKCRKVSPLVCRRWFMLVCVLVPLLAGCRKKAPPPQVPVDERSALWVEIVANGGGENVVIGYLLALGTAVPETSLKTNKGTIEMGPGSELWFSASEGLDQDRLATTESLTWTAQLAGPITAEDQYATKLTPIIDLAAALADKSGELVPDLTGPSSVVEWSALTALPSTMATYRFNNFGLADEFNLSLEMNGGKFGQIIWSSNLAPGTFALPLSFGTAGAFDMAIAEDPPIIKSAFSAYDTP